MINFIGGLPITEELLGIPHTHLHLYNKAPRKGRKVAHATVRTENSEHLTALIKQLTILANNVDDS
jgi:5-(carboxyamino)imidazole ribonucleotide synthase